MIRIPLRPLAKILRAREKGQNPDEIEAEARRLRHEAIQDKARRRAEGRLALMASCFVLAFGVVGVRMGTLASAAEIVPPIRYGVSVELLNPPNDAGEPQRSASVALAAQGFELPPRR